MWKRVAENHERVLKVRTCGRCPDAPVPQPTIRRVGSRTRLLCACRVFGVMRGTLLVLRQLDHVATVGVERYPYLARPAQAIDFEKHLVPSEFRQTGCQGIQVTPVRSFDCPENTIGHGKWRSHGQFLQAMRGRPLRNVEELFRQGPGVGVKGAAVDRAQGDGWGMKEPPPRSLERQDDMLLRWRGSVNRPVRDEERRVSEKDAHSYIPRCFLRIGDSLMAGFVGASSAAFLNDAVASSCFPILSSERAKL